MVFQRPCDFGDCDGDVEWALHIAKRNDNGIPFARLMVCEDCVGRAAEYMADFPRRSKLPHLGMTPLSKFDHKTRKWVPYHRRGTGITHEDVQ